MSRLLAVAHGFLTREVSGTSVRLLPETALFACSSCSFSRALHGADEFAWVSGINSMPWHGKSQEFLSHLLFSIFICLWVFHFPPCLSLPFLPFLRSVDLSICRSVLLFWFVFHFVFWCIGSHFRFPLVSGTCSCDVMSFSLFCRISGLVLEIDDYLVLVLCALLFSSVMLSGGRWTCVAFVSHARISWLSA